jgi:hypothetical protein
MNLTLRQMAEIAALVSAKSTLLIESPTRLSDESLQTYWKYARGRTVDWIRKLDDGNARISTSCESQHGEIWASLKPVVIEVFVSEILTRVWGATLTAYDRHQGIHCAAPIASNTTDGHTQARTLAMKLLVNGPQVPLKALAEVDQIRRKAERWSDLLVGHLAIKYGLEEFAFESRRSLEFGQSQMQQFIETNDEPVWEFVLAGVRLGFSSLQSEAVSATWNRGIVEAIIGSFPPDSFDATGVFQSVNLSRIARSGLSPEKTPPGLVRASTSDKPVSRLQFAKLKQRFDQD